jgi:hypothetical protein
MAKAAKPKKSTVKTQLKSSSKAGSKTKTATSANAMGAKGGPSAATGAQVSTGNVIAAAQRLDPAARHRMIEEAAYLIAEGRGFTPGMEVQNWLEAEAQVNARLSARA